MVLEKIIKFKLLKHGVPNCLRVFVQINYLQLFGTMYEIFFGYIFQQYLDFMRISTNKRVLVIRSS